MQLNNIEEPPTFNFDTNVFDRDTSEDENGSTTSSDDTIAPPEASSDIGKDSPASTSSNNPIQEVLNSFDPQELKDILIVLSKKDGVFRRTYDFLDGDFSITIKTLTSSEERSLNAARQQINTSGLKQRTVMRYPDPAQNTAVEQESDTYYNTDANRSIRMAELALRVDSINGDGVNLNSKEKLAWLDRFSDDILLHIYTHILVHFKLLVGEATRKLKVF